MDLGLVDLRIVRLRLLVSGVLGLRFKTCKFLVYVFNFTDLRFVGI